MTSKAAEVGEVDPTSDAALVARAGRQDAEAFGTLYERHVRTVYRYALSIVHSVHDAEDITQDVFVTAWNKASQITLIDQSALPWLLATARFTSLNRERLMARDRRNPAPDALSSMPDNRVSPDDEASHRILIAAIKQVVAELSVTDQAVYDLCIEQGLSYADAAKALGATHGAIRNRLGRVRHVLKTKFSDGGES